MTKNQYARQTLLVAGALSLIVLAVAARSTLWDRDETLYARAAAEMLQSGEWLVPTMNAEIFAHKPPLAIWTMAASMAVFGVNDLAARIPSVVSLACTGWLIFLLGRRLFSARVGSWASAIYMSSPMALYIGGAAMLDSTLTAFVCLGMWSHAQWLRRPGRWCIYWPVLALSVGLAELTKHPVGLAVLAPGVFWSTWMLRESKGISKSYWAGLLLAFLAGYAMHQAWYVSVCKTIPGFEEEMFWRHIVGRFFTVMEGHGASSFGGYLATLPLYIPVLIAGFAPWSAFLPGGISAFIRRRSASGEAYAILVAWAIPPFLLFSLAATKLPHYILPVFPPAALVAAAALEAWRTGKPSGPDRAWLRRGAWVLATVSLCFGGALCGAVFLCGTGAWRFAAIFPALLLIGVGIAEVRLILKEELLKTAFLFLAATPFLYLFSAMLVLPAVEPLIKVSPRLAEKIQQEFSIEEPVAMCGYTEPSFIFYMDLPPDERIAVLPETPEALRKWFAAPRTGWLVVYGSLWKQAENRYGPFENAQPRLKVPVLNTNDGARRDSVLVVRRIVSP